MSLIHDSRDAAMLGRRSDGSLARRPLSPHLQVYDMWQMSSFLSISHRITGVIWSVGLLLLVWWLVALSLGPDMYADVVWVMGSIPGKVVLAGMTAVAWYHTLNGLRHLFWDAGYGFSIPSMYRSGWLVVLGTLALTALTWLATILELIATEF